MGKPYRIMLLLLLFPTILGVSRGCNLFGKFASQSSWESKLEDVKVAVSQKDWIYACAITKEFKDAGMDYSEAKISIKDGLISNVFSDPDFFTCVIGGDCSGSSPICIMAKLNTADACNDATCLEVLDNCDDLVGTSSYANLTASIPGLSCSSAFLKCTTLQQWQGSVATSTDAQAALISCKIALKAVESDCPQFGTGFAGGPCNTTLNLPGAPCGADICNIDASGNCNDATPTVNNVLSTNYFLDASFLFMSNSGVSCP